MAGNFCGVLIFVIFVVDLAVTKFSHSRKLMPTVILYYVCKSMMMGVATNIVAARPTLLESNSSHCHPADSIFDTNILLSRALCPSLCRYGLVIKKI